MVPNAVPRMILLTAAALASASRSFVRLELAGIGQYGAAPALFLEQQRGGKVLPVPIPRQSVLACEQALSPGSPAMADVLLQCRLFASRNNGLIDQLPWQWNPSELAKRDGVARLSGRDYPQGARRYESPYHLLLDMCRREACADVGEVLIENTDLLGRVVLGGAVLVERRLPMAKDSGLHAAGAGPAPAEDARWWVRPAQPNADDPSDERDTEPMPDFRQPEPWSSRSVLAHVLAPCSRAAS